MNTKTWILYAGLLLLAGIAFAALTSFDKKTVFQTDVRLTTKSPVNITATSADCNYTIQVTGTEKVKIISSGIRVEKPGGVGGKNFEGRLSGGQYLSKLSGLTAAAKYTARAYANTSAGTFYGNVMAFATKEK